MALHCREEFRKLRHTWFDDDCTSQANPFANKLDEQRLNILSISTSGATPFYSLKHNKGEQLKGKAISTRST